MDEETDEGGGSGGAPRHTTPVNGVEVTSSTSNLTMSAGVLGNGVRSVDPNRNSVTSTTTQTTPSPSHREPGQLRTGNIIMMTLTQQDYEQEYWPRLDSAIHQLLAVPGQYPPLSYEQMYSCVYKCVCKQFAERLYQDLMAKVGDHLARCTQEIADPDARTYIEKFNAALNQYLQALGGIVPIFNYMNRFYVESKLGTDLRRELLNLFKLHVVDRHAEALMPLLLEAQSQPFLIAPAVMANVVTQLHALAPELVKTQPQLFAKFIPGALPPSCEADLEAQREMERRLQAALAADPDFASPASGGGGGALKRALD